MTSTNSITSVSPLCPYSNSLHLNIPHYGSIDTFHKYLQKEDQPSDWSALEHTQANTPPNLTHKCVIS